MNKQEDEQIRKEIANINTKISRLAKKGRECCGLSAGICRDCYNGIQKIQYLKIKKKSLYKKLSK